MRPIKFIWYLKFVGFFLYRKFTSLFRKQFNLSAINFTDNDLVNYYCKIDARFKLPENSPTLNDVKITSSSGYSHDFFRILENFPRSLKFNYLWGDVTHIPDCPTFVKSRPICGNNANSVLLPLDTYRHLHFPKDKLSYDEKLPMAVWRGSATQNHRVAFLKAASKLAFCNVANTLNPDATRNKNTWMTIDDQMKYKIIFSIEGYDVATNLKWIMGSNSLCFSPKPIYETWYREGQLIPNVHYVEINSDFSDIEEKFNYYMNNPDQAKQIIENAHNHVQPFLNIQNQHELAQLVAAKYFLKSGQTGN